MKGFYKNGVKIKPLLAGSELNKPSARHFSTFSAFPVLA
jgi:hypothetical protein